MLVIIAIIAILADIIFLVFDQAPEKARTTAYLSNMRQIGTGLRMYVFSGLWLNLAPKWRLCQQRCLDISACSDCDRMLRTQFWQQDQSLQVVLAVLSFRQQRLDFPMSKSANRSEWRGQSGLEVQRRDFQWLCAKPVYYWQSQHLVGKGSECRRQRLSGIPGRAERSPDLHYPRNRISTQRRFSPEFGLMSHPTESRNRQPIPLQCVNPGHAPSSWMDRLISSPLRTEASWISPTEMRMQSS